MLFKNEKRQTQQKNKKKFKFDINVKILLNYLINNGSQI